MSGTLVAQTIQGPSSGANANKVIIPSGHTLDASAATFRPSAGMVIQEVRTSQTSQIGSSSSTAYLDVMSATLTPVYSNSIIEIYGKLGLHHDGTANEGLGTRLLINGSVIAASGDGWQGIGSNSNKFLTFQHNHSRGDSMDLYTEVPLHAWGNYGVTAGQANTFKVQMRPWISTGGTQSVNHGGYNASTLIVREIAQ